MKITFAPKGILQIDNAHIIYRNFSGLASKYNREGDRNFAVIVETQDIADALIENGWNVKIKPPREEGDDPFIYFTVKVKFNDHGPNVYLKTGGIKNKLDEESVDILDKVDIINVDLDVRPYDWEVNDKTGRTAYLQSIMIEQEVDRFADRYDDED